MHEAYFQKTITWHFLMAKAMLYTRLEINFILLISNKMHK